MSNWRAPHRGRKPVDLEIEIPGSKSVTNRALILAAQSQGISILRKPLISRDSELMVAGLKALGIQIDNSDKSQFKIIGGKPKGPAKIDAGNAGTVMRFLPAFAALSDGEIEFDGDPRSHERPLAPVIKALEDLGARIFHEGRYSLPFTIINGDIRGGEVEIDASKSSQFISALLLIAPSTKDGIKVRHKGTSLPSMPHINMTVQMLRDFGAKVHVDDSSKTWNVEPGPLQPRNITIEPDLSNAAPFLSIAMLCGGSVTIKDWPMSTTQPGDQLRDILQEMGAEIELTGSGLNIKSNGQIKGIERDLHEVGELTPAIATLCAFATTPSYLSGIEHLRLHETDRLAAITKEFNSLGGNVIEEESALRIIPQPMHAGLFHTYEDHRLATSAATIGLIVEGIEVENIDTTRKTITDFPGLWNSLVQKGAI